MRGKTYLYAPVGLKKIALKRYRLSDRMDIGRIPLFDKVERCFSILRAAKGYRVNDPIGIQTENIKIIYIRYETNIYTS